MSRSSPDIQILSPSELQNKQSWGMSPRAGRFRHHRSFIILLFVFFVLSLSRSSLDLSFTFELSNGKTILGRGALHRLLSTSSGDLKRKTQSRCLRLFIPNLLAPSRFCCCCCCFCGFFPHCSDFTLMGIWAHLEFLQGGGRAGNNGPKEKQGWGSGGMIRTAFLEQPPRATPANCLYKPVRNFLSTWDFFTFVLFLRFHAFIFSSSRIDFGGKSPS